MFYKVVSHGPHVPPEPAKWTVCFYRDNDVIEFAGGYFQAGTYYGNVRKWAAVIPTANGWDYAEWSPVEQSWVRRTPRFHLFTPYEYEEDE
jgi:hypothetical protein